MPDPLDPSLKKQLQKKDLKYCTDATSGFFRQKVNKNFKYYNLSGKLIQNKKDLDRIKSLSIPPAWKEVWIAPFDNCHLQATGKDSKNRKQYIYHPRWIEISQENKFDKMVDFGLSLPKIRGKINYDLESKKLDKRKILATVIWLLEHTFIRIGNEEYEKENASFGLTTLHNKHVTITGPKITFRFIGKKGIPNLYEVSNLKIAKTVKKCSELPGYQIFQFIDDNGNRHLIDSEDVNLFLKDVTGEDFSAKDFRTWGGTKLSANNFYSLGNAPDKGTLKKNIIATIAQVAHHLNNTVSVCRNYYIHPTVINTYQTNVLVPHFKRHPISKQRGLSWDEYALVELLQKY